jgi:hypothetical protein
MPELRASSSELLVGMPDVRRSMRLLNCYLPRSTGGDSSSNQQQQAQQPDQLPRQQPQQRQQQQSGWQSILQQAGPKQQLQQQAQAPSRLQQQAPRQLQPQPEEVLRALQMQKLQVSRACASGTATCDWEHTSALCAHGRKCWLCAHGMGLCKRLPAACACADLCFCPACCVPVLSCSGAFWP